MSDKKTILLPVPDHSLRPGDYVIVNGDKIEIEEINLLVDSNGEVMEIIGEVVIPSNEKEKSTSGTK